jgi:hypothetical protein
MKWVLVIMIWWNNGVGTTSANFEDEQACLAAAQKTEKAWGFASRTICVPTSSGS